MRVSQEGDLMSQVLVDLRCICPRSGQAQKPRLPNVPVAWSRMAPRHDSSSAQFHGILERPPASVALTVVSLCYTCHIVPCDGSNAPVCTQFR